MLTLGDILLNDLHEVWQGHDCTTDHEVVETFFVFTTQMGRLAVLQSDGIADLLSHANFLARAVDELELAVGKENGQRDAGETTARAEIEDLTAWTETDDLGYRHRVKHVVLVEVVDVFAGDDIDFLVPVAIERIEGVNLLALLWREVGEVFADEWMHGQSDLFRISSSSE